MDWAWRFGMVIVSGVPAIVGGGLAWVFFESWTAVAVWEAVLAVAIAAAILKGPKRGGKKGAASPQGAH